jgi:CheY-like chemotaxis protein
MRLLNVAVVDHDPANLRSISVVLDHSIDRAQLDVHYFTDSIDALDWMSSGCDLVITALEMPVIDGARLLREVKEYNAHAQVIVLAATATREQLDELAEWGASDFLFQPLDKLLLRELVEQAVARVRRWQLALRTTRASQLA